MIVPCAYEELPPLDSVKRCPKCGITWEHFCVRCGTTWSAAYAWETTNVWSGAMRRTCGRCAHYWFEQAHV